ncbi:MAG: undecaprenyl/decaprenyl-phosphate alpha-N-acetylglucosaminyl 1-phosphate transferase [Sphingobacteriales bacterium]|nr:MAG: undecaprenyl/decaprenyl-phosphate alpha-N-acetylglucosaminyl 1-phosphate transferase [Sphingobacteriales bacterium]
MVLSLICVFFSALVIVCFCIKKIIYVAKKCHLFDNPNEIRKVHLDKTPNLGGVAIYITIITCAAIFVSYYPIPKINYIFVASIIIFTLGLTDDLVGVDPKKKFFAQFIASLTITVIANIRFTSFYGIFGIGEIPYGLSIVLSALFIIFLINAFNLIDGINCLAGGVALLANIVFAICFWQMHQLGFMFLAVTICGVLIGFLFYNKTPAKIFMGDTGSLSLGLIMAVFSINFIESNYALALLHKPVFTSAAVIVLGLLIIPIFDALRVFTLRILNGKSPFDADRNHIHHRLLDFNFTHLQATATLLVINISFITIVFFFNSLGNEKLLFIIVLITLLLNGSSWLLLNKKNNKSNNYDIVSDNLLVE